MVDLIKIIFVLVIKHRRAWLEDNLSWKIGAITQVELSKNLICPLPVLDPKDESFRDLLSQSSVHIGGQDEEITTALPNQKEAKPLARLDVFLRG